MAAHNSCHACGQASTTDAALANSSAVRGALPPLGRTNTIRIPKYCASFLTYFHKVEELGATSAKESEATAGRLSV